MPEKTPTNDILEGQAGCQYHMALLVCEAQAACEQAFENFRHWSPEDFPQDVLAALKVIAESEVSL